MNKNGKKKHNIGRVISRSFVMLSFVIAFVAIFSLATVGVVKRQGVDVKNYKEPSVMGNSFTFGYEESGGYEVTVQNEAGFAVPIYFSKENGIPVYCVQYGVEPLVNSTYEKGSTITDAGLLYLLNEIENGALNGLTGNNASYAKSWAAQLAIWVYLQETNSDPVHQFVVTDPTTGDPLDFTNDAKSSTNTLTITNGATELGTYSNGSDLYSYVQNLVTAAKSASNNRTLSVTKANGDLTKSGDGTYYQTTLITVTGNPASEFINYDISISGIEGATVVGENGNALSSLTGVAPGTKFAVRIPADKVTETKQNLHVAVVGHFNILTGNYYGAQSNPDSHQKVITVTGTTKNVNGSLDIEVVGSPDTGVNTAQTIYFIGLIVLLCGVGIVYANAKPVESKQ